MGTGGAEVRAGYEKKPGEQESVRLWPYTARAALRCH
jgi:hypothetical protein